MIGAPCLQPALIRRLQALANWPAAALVRPRLRSDDGQHDDGAAHEGSGQIECNTHDELLTNYGIGRADILLSDRLFRS
ncbi:MAG: hypothetical protein CL680_04290 [Blastomonas sp.]|jgi:hypothetical protein|nr:hypothetical protein [Blastomonas sp.]